MTVRVMMIGDDHPSATDLADTLRSFGYQITRASTNWPMFAALREDPEVVLIDLSQPLDAALVAAREIDAAYQVPVVVLTSQPPPTIPPDERFIVLAKPLPQESLRSVINAIARIQRTTMHYRKANEQLRHTIDILEEAQALAEVGHWEEHLGTHEIHVSPECLTIHDLPPLPPPASMAKLFANIHPGDRERIEELLARARKDGKPYDTEYRLMKLGKPWRIVHQRVAVHRDSNGRPFRLVSMVHDVTEQRYTEDELQQTEQRSSQLLRERDFLLENSRDVLYYIDDKWNIYYISPAVEQISGYTVEEWQGPFTAHLVDTPNNRRAIAETVEILRTGRTYPPSDIDIRHKNGNILIAEVNEQPIIANDRVFGIVGVARDVTEKRQAEHRLRQATAVFDNMLEAATITDSERRITAVNRSFMDITGYAESEVIGMSADFVSSSTEDGALREKVWESVAQTGRWAGEMWNRRKSGEAFPAWVAISTIRDAANRITNYVSLSSDLSRIRESEEKLDRLAHYDPLTRLPNRLLFNSRLSHAIRGAERQRQKVAVLFVDLDYFKNVNDTLGHPAGDRLLQEVAHRLSGCLRKEDTVAHLGGDEFVIVLEDFRDPRRLIDVAQKVLRSIRQPFALDGQQTVITASMGISIYPTDGEDATRLLQNADAAMYHAKDLGRSTFQFYTAELTAHAVERMTLANALQSALKNGEFVLHYQPQLSLESDSVVGVEALIRWRHPERGLLQPTAFIPLGEETGLIATVGEWVLRTACAQAREWEEAGAGPVRMAINLSALQLTRDVELVEQLANILHETRVNPQQIELEITESAIMRDPEQAVAMLGELKTLGIRLAIDDFGIGYSSMNYLKTFAVNSLKVDSSFVHDLPADASDKAIVRAIIALGHSLQMKVIAEGVETLEQRMFLRDNGCDEIQGFLLSPPLPEQQCREMLLHSVH